MGSSGEDEGGWLNWFHELPVHRWMCRVDASFLEDAFNLYGIADELAAAGAWNPARRPHRRLPRKALQLARRARCLAAHRRATSLFPPSLSPFLRPPLRRVFARGARRH